MLNSEIPPLNTKSCQQARGMDGSHQGNQNPKRGGAATSPWRFSPWLKRHEAPMDAAREVERWRGGEVERWRGGEVERWRGEERRGEKSTKLRRLVSHLVDDVIFLGGFPNGHPMVYGPFDEPTKGNIMRPLGGFLGPGILIHPRVTVVQVSVRARPRKPVHQPARGSGAPAAAQGALAGRRPPSRPEFVAEFGRAGFLGFWESSEWPWVKKT